MEINVPFSTRRKALFLIDVQPNTMQHPGLQNMVPLILQFIRLTDYDAYVDANYYSDERSMFYKQNGFIYKIEETGPTSRQILDAVAEKNKPQILVQKNTRSCFKGDNAEELRKFLADNQIEENHFVGFDINDCVLGSAYESIDLGFYTYVIEELSHIHNADPMMKNATLAIFRMQNMTNNDPRNATITLHLQQTQESFF